MPIYNIADLNILINPSSDEIKKRISPYIVNSDSFDFEVKVSQNDISDFISNSKHYFYKFLLKVKILHLQRL